MSTKSYAEKLRDPRWQKRRLEVLKHADFRCQVCGSARSTLHVHHSYYRSGKEPWQYPVGSMIAVCEAHHKAIHAILKPSSPEIDVPEPIPPSDVDAPVTPERAKMYFAKMRALVAPRQ